MKIILMLSTVVAIVIASQQDAWQSRFNSQMVRMNDKVDGIFKKSSSSSSSESIEDKSLINRFKDALNCTIDPPPTLDELYQFYQWVQKYNKSYYTPENRLCRTIHVIRHIRQINAHNVLYEQGLVSYKRGLTDFSDYSSEENYDRLLLKEAPIIEDTLQGSTDLPILPPARDSVDWRNEGLVSPVGSQWKCGSCYAWGGAVALEGQLRKCKISSESVSIQLMVDCPNHGVWGCSSGWPYYVFKWQMSGGILPASKYPYKDTSGKCNYNKSDVIAYVDTPYKFNFTDVGGNATFIKQVVSATGPVSIIICVDKSLFQYKSGVYTTKNCCNTVKHVVGIVGYGTDPKFGDYWIIKNSWGTNWGDKGFAKIARGNNLCITENYVQYASLKDVNGRKCDLMS
ncbi:hypothetical protein ACKWTF_014922 [Chironomus riparius]